MNKNLKPEVASAFDCSIRNKSFDFKGTNYIMSGLTVEVVEKLVKDGCDIFKPKGAKTNTATPGSPEKK